MIQRALGVLFGIPLLTGLVVVVQPQERLTKRILFVVDVSGSMRGDKFTKACEAVLRITEQPVDEVQIGVLAFNEVPSRWRGIPEEHPTRPVPVHWAALPSAHAVESASAFLAETGAGGDTLVIPALQAALGEPRDQLSIVLVSDGIFQREDASDILGAVRKGQAARVERGVGQAIVMAYGVGSESPVLKQLGQVGRGGYIRERTVRPAFDPSGIQGTWR